MLYDKTQCHKYFVIYFFYSRQFCVSQIQSSLCSLYSRLAVVREKREERGEFDMLVPHTRFVRDQHFRGLLQWIAR